MWFSKRTLRDIFEDFKESPNAETAEELYYEAEKREKIVKTVSEIYIQEGKRKIAKEMQDKFRNTLSAIGGFANMFLRGNATAEFIIPIIEESIGEYERIFEEFDENLKEHIEEIKRKLRIEHEILELERNLA